MKAADRASLDDIEKFLGNALKLSEFEDYPNALNGLQIANSGIVTKVAAAVDACEATLEEAVRAGADLLLVHHGLFWSGLTRLTGSAYRKTRLAIENNLAVYSAHLPLDAHPDFGNNALLAAALGFTKDRQPFLEFKGRPIGLVVEAEINREVLNNRIEGVVGGQVILAPGGPVSTRRIGIVTGGAGSEVLRVAAEGVDTFITGEGPHWCYTAAEEAGVNLFLVGHYATETFGVKALAERLAKRFRIGWTFIDHPTGL